MRKDLAFEALADVTNTNWETGRGELNFSLASIRKQTENLLNDEQLADEIRARADFYREVFPGAALTPAALNKHWERVVAERPRPSGVNLTAEHPSTLPPRHQQGLTEVRKLMETLWPS